MAQAINKPTILLFREIWSLIVMMDDQLEASVNGKYVGMVMVEIRSYYRL